VFEDCFVLASIKSHYWLPPMGGHGFSTIQYLLCTGRKTKYNCQMKIKKK